MDLKTVIDSTPIHKEQRSARPRRSFTTEFKQHLVELCQQPDTSVAKVAMQYQINANLLHKWMSQSKSKSLALGQVSHQQTDFLPIVMNPASTTDEPEPSLAINHPVANIRIPLPHSDQMIEIDWPVQSTMELLPLIQSLIK
ncbi:MULTISPECIES: IS66-like element accessory protein TnpA [Acinetobacter]|uniref:IS66-like element accessory protein TnpA n=1 Tax=Acinetobacter TaxID=469 RepID=UPI001C0B9AE2|nr:transposase [Acinetobacter seifertii]MBU3086656.1 transposase [Acinetobacter seifertii]